MKRYLIALAVVVVVMFVATLGRTTLPNRTIQIVDNLGNLIAGGVASGTTASPNETVQVVNNAGNVLTSFGATGLTGLTGTPMWARFFGDGSEGAGPASGALAAGEHWFTTWNCTGNITLSSNGGVIIRATGTVTLGAACVINSGGAHVNGGVGNLGGSGASGGSGAANSVASVANSYYNLTIAAVNAPYIISARAAASSAGAGLDGGALATSTLRLLRDMGPPVFPSGGGIGTQGGSSGGAAGLGGLDIIIIAPTITVANGTVIDASGSAGGDAAANSTGAGGGGGGGAIWLISESFTDSGGVYKYGGGSGGAITTPTIKAGSDGCTTAGCGTDAAFTVTSLSSGGLSAAGITIANAGTGYNKAPTCIVTAGTSGLTGSPACHFTVSGGAIASVVIDTAGSGGVLTTFTTAFIGGYGANGDFWQPTIQ